MALKITKCLPQELLSKIKKAVDEKTIQTWSYDNDGDFTHTPEQWQYKAWMRPVISNGELSFVFLGQKSVQTTKLIYGVYHGRFSEMLLTHFDTEFRDIEITAMPSNGDFITAISNVQQS